MINENLLYKVFKLLYKYNNLSNVVLVQRASGISKANLCIMEFSI